MKIEKSCGAVIYRKNLDIIEYLIIKQISGEYWGFAKGHTEENETEEETATREIYEETGLKGVFNNSFREENEYIIKENILKKVVYFLLEVKNWQNEKYQKEEIEDFKWLKKEEAIDIITFQEQKEILIKADKTIKY